MDQSPARELSSEVQAHSPADYEEKKRRFYGFFGENERRLGEATDALANLIRLLIASNGPEGAKVSSRVKNKHECISKFDLKYRQELEKRGDDYEIKDHITDIVGVRVVCLYESQINDIVDQVRKEFRIVKEEDKALDLYEKLRFGYKGVHLDVALSATRADLPEYKRFADLAFELQIRSIVQDAWSEVDHRLKYKKQIPDPLKRRIVRLAALFELADQEFEEIRKTTDRVEAEIKDQAREQKLSPEGADEDVTLDAFNFLRFVSRRYPGYNFEPHKVDGFVDDIKKIHPNITLAEFRRIVDEHFSATHEYRSGLRDEGININPYTHMRHMFVADDPELYGDMLYPRQKAGFVEWMKGGAAASEKAAGRTPRKATK